MEKYYKASAIGALIEKLLRTPYYSHEGESWYSGVSAVWDAIIELPVEEADINELKRHVADLNNRRHLIWAIGCDYDGCNTVKSLKELIDELVSYTQLPEDQIPDITSRTGRWVKAECSEKDGDATCSACGHWNWSDCKYCPNCGAKMRKTIDEEV